MSSYASVVCSLFAKNKASLASFSRIPLLKKIVSVTDEIFTNDEHFEQDRNIIGEHKRNSLLKAVLNQNFEDIADFTEDYYKVVDVCDKRQQLTRDFIYYALEENSGIAHNFNKFDVALIRHATRISNFYHAFYVKFLKAVQGNLVSKELEKRQATIDHALTNSYTIILLDEKTNEFYDVAYADFFKDELKPIIDQFNALLKDLNELKEAGEEHNDLVPYIKYIEKYRDSFMESDKSKLEELNKELDELWMDVKYHIQYVHDIECGYGDVLRCKSTPDFSCRFIDEEYSEVNNFISTKVQNSLVEYFKARNTEIGNNGINAVQNSMCYIYCIPFASAQSMSFRFSGQSIPNRTEVKNAKGVKIYFDPISTASRIKQTCELVDKVFSNSQELHSYMSAVDIIKNHVAAHEIGHAIYNLDVVKEHIKLGTRTLLEEPRAELTALSTMKMLFDNKYISKEELTKTLASFAMQDLRRFAMFDKSNLRPYIISAISTYGIYEKLGYVTLQDDRVHFNHDKVEDVLSAMKELFEKILTAEDVRNGEELEEILTKMQEQSQVVNWLVSKLFRSE